jgi:hypothetical protein
MEGSGGVLKEMGMGERIAERGRERGDALGRATAEWL